MKHKNWKNKENCVIDALNYANKSEWIKCSGASYQSALKNGWISDCCGHMKRPQNWNKKWIKETCTIEAKKYNTRTIFQKQSSGAYCAAYDNNWIDEICSHMTKTGNNKNRCIYSYEFSDNSVYIGLTYSLEKRQINRNNDINDAVTKHISNTGLIPIRKQLTEYISVDSASKQESAFIQQYKVNGWNILNRNSGGGIGGNYVLWTLETCKEEALKYNYRGEFKKKSKSAYVASLKNEWLNIICEHMQYKYTLWTFEKCKVEALKYNTKHQFRENSKSACQIAYRNKWIFDICQHMTVKKKPNGYWSKEKCLLDAKKYDTVREFRKKSNSAYVTIINNGWISEIEFLKKYERI